MSKMTVMKAKELRDAPLIPHGIRSGADRGDPQTAILPLSPEAAGSTGIWECQPGSWPVKNRSDTEFAYLLSGRAKLTDDADGHVMEVTAGDLVILPPGWSGRWEIIETVRKIYAIY